MKEKTFGKYRIISSKVNLWVFINLNTIRSYEDFHKLDFVNRAQKYTNTSFQKLWNFFATTPVLEAWWNGEKLISEFLVNIDKQRKVYPLEHLDLFINERLIPLEILPSIISDFLGLESSREIKTCDENAIKNIEVLCLCKVCDRKVFPSEIAEQLSNTEGVCYYCLNKLSPEIRREIETPYLFKKRINETWKALTEKQREQLLFNILRESRKPLGIEGIQKLKALAKKLSTIESIFSVDFSPEELESVVRKLDKDYFIIWWEKIK
ncbi:MAG: hypothetical protein ABDH28_06070 [Brevinematia bacterium]